MTLVETYEDVEQLGPESETECSAEALELIEQLNLDGQRELISSRDGGTIERMPYRKMTKEEAFVCRMICPEHTKLEKYNAGQIPVRVLQVAAHAKPMFDTIWVLHPKQVIRDPFLVGQKSRYDFAPFVGDMFMLARWGAELASWDELKSKAASLFREQYKSAIAGIRAELTGIDIDAIPDGILCSASGVEMPRLIELKNW